ncbi:hypothetical protein KBY55_32355, partial [Streptomyces sp. b94]|nr:hypothetical protein [Streptomyces sp. b94]
CITVGHEGLSVRCRRRNPHRTGRPSPVQDPSAETWLTRPQPPETEHLDRLAERGYNDVETAKTADESITFSLPKELRRDLRAEAARPSQRQAARTEHTVDG